MGSEGLGSEVHPGECPICTVLRDREYASQKWGWDQHDSYLPAAAEHLEVVRDYRTHGSRQLQLQRCPECGTYYLYRTDYEYLVDGSEDEQTLTRLTGQEAAEYLQQSTPEKSPAPRARCRSMRHGDTERNREAGGHDGG